VPALVLVLAAVPPQRLLLPVHPPAPPVKLDAAGAGGAAAGGAAAGGAAAGTDVGVDVESI
jgi:hypothetical protein